MLVVVNYASHPSPCYPGLPFPEMEKRSVQLANLLSTATDVRDGNELSERGLYLDLQSWSYRVFDLELSR